MPPTRVPQTLKGASLLESRSNGDDNPCVAGKSAIAKRFRSYFVVRFHDPQLVFFQGREEVYVSDVCRGFFD